MNRQQRRRLKRKESKLANYNITSEQLATMGSLYEAQTKEELEKKFYDILCEEQLLVYERALYIPLLVLRNMGWGKKRLSEFAHAMCEQVESLGQGYFKIQDIKDTIQEETGVLIDFSAHETRLTIDVK